MLIPLRNQNTISGYILSYNDNKGKLVNFLKYSFDPIILVNFLNFAMIGLSLVLNPHQVREELCLRKTR